LFKELDLSGLPALARIYFHNNKIKYLNVLGVPLSASLSVYYEKPEWICAHPNQLNRLKTDIDLQGVILDPTCNFSGWKDFKTLLISVNYTSSGDCNSNTERINNAKFKVFSDFLDVYIEPKMNSNGLYEFKLPAGDYTLTPVIDNAEFFEFTPNPLALTINSTDSIINKSFCVKSKKMFLLIVQYILCLWILRGLVSKLYIR
jgi:hypothetical protein